MISIRFFLSIFLVGFLLGSARPVQAQHAVWATMLPNAQGYLSLPSSSVTDGAGNTYVAGTFRGRLSAGGLTVVSSDPRDVDIFYAKYNAGGQIQWLVRTGSVDTTRNNSERPSGLALDGQGHLYVSGLMMRNWSMGAFSDTLFGNFLAKLNTATGQPLWARRIEGDGRSAESRTRRAYIRGLGCDQTGRLYLCAEANRLDSLGNLPTAVTSSGVILARCDGNGVFDWNTPMYCEATGPQPMFQLDQFIVNPQGEIAVSGILHGRLLVGSLTNPAFTVPSTDTGTVGFFWDAFVARFRPDGTPRWARLVDGASGQSVFGMALDGSSNLLLTGRTYGAMRIDALTAPAGQFVAKLDASGAPLWLTSPSTGSQNAANYSLTVDAAGNAYTAGWFYQTIVLGDFILTGDMSGAYNASLCVASYDPAGRVRWARTSGTNQATGHATGLGIGRDTGGHLYVFGSTGTSISDHDYDGHPIKGIGAFLLRFDESAQISGTVYLDQNANGRRDAGESPFGRPTLVSETARPYAATANPATGHFTVFADTGAYTVALPQLPANYLLTQGAAGYTGHLRSYGQTDTARTFGLAPIANRPDVRVTLTPYSAARRGFANRYRIRVENLGTTTVSGQTTAQLDALIPYVGATPPPTSHTTSAATWDFQNLPPFGHLDYLLVGNVLLNVPLDTTLTSRVTTTIANDFDPTNNVDVVQQRVVGSFDPNDMTVNYTTLTSAQVAAQTPLDYTIRFQNMGTDTAFTVVITDTLPANLLRMGTLQLISSSHNCWWDILDNNHLIVRFDNINLPDHNVSTLGSLGFVRFRVAPKSTLTPGAVIPNTAHITFDYNAPLSTNPVSTLVQNLTGLPHAPGATALSLYPNPATERTLLTADLPTAGTVQVLLTDALGREVRRTSVTAPAGTWQHPLSTGGLTPGVYGVRLTLPDGATVSRRLVVQ